MSTKENHKETKDKEQPKTESAKEVASRVSGKIRNLENLINANRPTPPDPEIAAGFDAIQRDLDAIKNAE